VRRTVAIASVTLVAALLACSGSAPASSRCRRTVDAPRQVLPSILVVVVQRLTCAQGARVLREVAPALGKDYYDRLGRTRDRRVAGYRCSGYLIGDASWKIVCRRGRRSVTGLTAE
jgi:hypothetical protein